MNDEVTKSMRITAETEKRKWAYFIYTPGNDVYRVEGFKTPLEAWIALQEHKGQLPREWRHLVETSIDDMSDRRRYATIVGLGASRIIS